jgi:hypothetical protein
MDLASPIDYIRSDAGELSVDRAQTFEKLRDWNLSGPIPDVHIFGTIAGICQRRRIGEEEHRATMELSNLRAGFKAIDPWPISLQ